MVEATRGAVVESVHIGAAAVVDRRGQLIARAGNPQVVTYLRSSSKPIQALPFVEAGGMEAFGITERELALMCASHSGTDEHVAVARSIQQKIGVDEDRLLCGTHRPYHTPTWEAMLHRSEAPTPNRHNCSGKHSGFLAYALLRDAPIDEYIAPEHPIQQTILQTFAEMSGVPAAQIHTGIDGCSAPVFAVPLYNAALAFARLADPTGLPEPRARACRRIVQAMIEHPDMVAGPERFDTEIMRLCAGRLVAKGGAEGYQTIALLPGALGEGSPALGIAIKIADGDLGKRAVPLVAVEILRQLGALSDAELAQLRDFGPRPVLNWRKIEAGELRPVFKLIREA